jgi:D-alanyl-D-alanine carboxypeptidase
MGERVLIATPALPAPLTDAGEIVPAGRDRGDIVLAGGYASHGEGVQRVRAGKGKVAELWLGGGRYLPEPRLAAELRRRYGRPAR